MQLTQGAKNSTRDNFSPMTSFSNEPAVRSMTSESAAATRLAKRVAPTGRIEVKRIVGDIHWRIVWFREGKGQENRGELQRESRRVATHLWPFQVLADISTRAVASGQSGRGWRLRRGGRRRQPATGEASEATKGREETRRDRATRE